MVHESEFFVKGIFIDIVYEATQVSDDQVRQLLTTVALLPQPHLQHIPVIHVGDRPPRGGGGSAPPSAPGGPFIRLNRTSFASRWNRGAYNETLLHEIGHIVDWAFHCMTIMQRADPEGYRALTQHPHRGRTQFSGEHYADGYADYFLGRRMSAERRSAIEHSNAF